MSCKHAECSYITLAGVNEFQTESKASISRHNRTLYYHTCCSGDQKCSFGEQYVNSGRQVRWINSIPRWASRHKQRGNKFTCRHRACKRTFDVKRTFEMHCNQSHRNVCDPNACVACNRPVVKRPRVVVKEVAETLANLSALPGVNEVKQEEEKNHESAESNLLNLLEEAEVQVEEDRNMDDDFSTKFLVEVRKGVLYYQTARHLSNQNNN